jgi:simple sugar transport system permease protein
MAAILGYEFRFERRIALRPSRRIAVSLLSVGLAFLAGFVLVLAAGVDALRAYSEMFRVFGTVGGIAQALAVGAPILLVAIGLAVAFRAGFWNIGAEGQLFMGAFAATGITFLAPSLPPATVLPLMALAGFVGGAGWGVIPALLKSRLGVNEVLTTLMMNFIGILWVVALIVPGGPWNDASAAGLGFIYSPVFPSEARLPRLPGLAIDITVIIGVILAVTLYLLLGRSRLGFEIRVLGESSDAARYAGIAQLRTSLLVMVLSGGLAGLAGFAIVSGAVGRLRPNVSPGYGYSGIIVAWLAGLNILGVIPAAFLFGWLDVGGDILQTSVRLPGAFAFLFQALIFIFVITGEVFTRYRLRMQRVLRE